MKIPFKQILFAALFVAIGVAIGLLIRSPARTGAAPAKFSEMRESGYSLIDPLLECDMAVPTGEGAQALHPFEEKIEESIRRIRNPFEIDRMSVYFRELNDGLWLSFGDVDRFSPKSLLKVPLMIAIFKEAERDPGILKRTVVYHGRNELSHMQGIKPAKLLTFNQTYTIDELISRMIIYSDNDAFSVLEGLVNPEIYKKVYSDLGIPMAYIEQQDYSISAEKFASFFRILYNASYLDREFSQRALRLLTQVDFRKGIAAGVPAGIPVADKFGEGNDPEAEMHDCGIVYYPQHPYLLCIMSRGRNHDLLDDAIEAVSRTIYAEVNAQHVKEHTATR